MIEVWAMVASPIGDRKGKEKMERQQKVTGLEEAASLIKDGDTITTCGFNMQNKPMALVREIIRQGKKDLFLVTAGPAGIDADMLIGAGCVRKVASVSISAERFGPIGPCFRRAAHAEKIEIWEVEQGIMVAGLTASAKGLPFMPTLAGLGTDILKVNKDLKLFNDPIEGTPLVAVPRIRPDWALVHTFMADAYGNAQHGGALFFDDLAVRASVKVILTTDNVVPSEVLKKDPRLTKVLSHMTAAVVEVPFGAHPTASHGSYSSDEKAIEEYIKLARAGEEAFAEYIAKYVVGPQNHTEYLNLIGIDRLLSIRTKVRL